MMRLYMIVFLPLGMVFFLLLILESLPAMRENAESVIRQEQIKALVIKNLSPDTLRKYAKDPDFEERHILQILDFYEKNDFLIAWHDQSKPLPSFDSLLAILSKAHEEGLRTSSYHVDTIRRYHAFLKNRDLIPDTGRIAGMDVMITVACFQYARHLYAGRFSPELPDSLWLPAQREYDFSAHIPQAMAENRIGQALRKLAPSYDQYDQLKEQLMLFRHIWSMGGWPRIPDKNLFPGDRAEEIGLVKHRLVAENYLDSTALSLGQLFDFDEEMEEAVKTFQRNYNLRADGFINAATREVLNVSIEDRIKQIELNMERFRWLPPETNGKYVMVNLPEYQLRLFEKITNNTNNESLPNGANKESVANTGPVSKFTKVLSMKVIVGEQAYPTTVLSGKLERMIFNPEWQVLPGVAIREKLPLIRKDVNYLKFNHYKVYDISGEDTVEVNPHRINWDLVNERNFHYLLVQEPGPDNYSGRLKFDFSNYKGVYLHETPDHSLFEKPERIFSYYTVPVEMPVVLAEHLLGNTVFWIDQTIEMKMDQGTTTTVFLPEEIPIHLVYMTAAIDENGHVRFFNDVYGYDSHQLRVMDAPDFPLL